MAEVSCNYVATAPVNAVGGTIKLTECKPSISNDETLGSWDVIIIVAILVALGLVGQFVLHHINRKALNQIWQAEPSKQ